MNKQTLNYGIWQITNTKGQIALMVASKNAGTIKGQNIDELIAKTYFSIRTKNKLNIAMECVGIDSLPNFSAELICQTHDKSHALKVKKALKVSLPK
jgi:hypothetical protein